MLIRDEDKKRAVLRVLADEYSRKIFMSLIDRAESVNNISRANDIPIATAYRRIAELEELGLLTVERGVLTQDGKRYELYRSSFRQVSIFIENGRVEVDVIPIRDVVSKLESMWISLGEAR
jgi:DNA-binding transcriptional ArsR family regulator